MKFIRVIKAGANFLTATIPEVDFSKVEKIYNDIVKDCIKQYGEDPYNGTFSTLNGIKNTYKEFNTRKEAYNYILDTAEKWEYALAAIVKEEGKEPYTLVGGWVAE